MRLFHAILWLALGCFFGWLAPTPLNFVVAGCGLIGAWVEMALGLDERDDPKGPPPFQKHYHYAPKAQPYVQMSRHTKLLKPAERIAREKGESVENKIVVESSGMHKRCQKCRDWALTGLHWERGTDKFFVCFPCTHGANERTDLDRMATDIQKIVDEERRGLFELNLSEKDALLLDVLMRAVYSGDAMQLVSRLELREKIPGYAIVPKDIFDLKQKISLLGQALRSSKFREESKVL